MTTQIEHDDTINGQSIEDDIIAVIREYIPWLYEGRINYDDMASDIVKSIESRLKISSVDLNTFGGIRITSDNTVKNTRIGLGDNGMLLNVKSVAWFLDSGEHGQLGRLVLTIV